MAAVPPDHAVGHASQSQQCALLELAVSLSPAIFYIAGRGPERRTRFISSNVEAITGHKPAAFLRHPGYRYGHIHPDDLPGYERGLEALRNG